MVAAALVGVAGRNADAPTSGNRPASSVAPTGDTAPVDVPTTVTPSTIHTSGVVQSVDNGPVGVFPAGDAAAVAAAGYESPQAVVAAYLQSRIDPTLVPGEVDVTATVYSSRLVTNDRAVVSFGLQMPDDSSDGTAEVARVPAGDGAAGGGWAVVQAFVFLEAPVMSLHNGQLRGAVSGPYPTAILTVTDGSTGEELERQDLSVPADPTSSGRPPGLPVAVDDLSVTEVGVRVWNTDRDGSARPVFGEFLVRAGSPVVTGSRVIGLDAYPEFPFFTDAAVSAIDELGNGETLTIADGDDVIVASHDVGGHTYCVTATSGGLHQQSCWPLSMIAAGDAREFVGSLLYRIVPDAVTVTQDGEEISVVGNVWFTHTDDMGRSPLVEFTDGQVTQSEGGEPGVPPMSSLLSPSTTSEAPPTTIVVRPAGVTIPPTLAPSEIAASPNAASLYPMADGVDPSTARLSAVATGPAFTELAVGRITDGRVRDAVWIDIGPAEVVGSSDTNGVPVTIYGQAGTLVTDTIAAGEGNSIVTWGDDPTFVAVGADPMAFLESSATSPFARRDDDAANPTIEVGTLANGYELLVPPQTVGGLDVVIGSIQLGYNTVSVGTQNAAASMVTSGPTQRVDVAGRPGWAFVENADTSNDATWQVDDHTYAYLKIEDGSSPEEALALAESVTFLPLDEWLALYTPDLPTAPTPTVAPSR